MTNNANMYSLAGIVLMVVSTVLTILNLSPIFVILSVVFLVVSLVLLLLGQRNKDGNKILNKIAFVFLIISIFEIIIIFFMIIGLLISSLISI